MEAATVSASAAEEKRYNVLILGASYGSLLSTKILLAGHDVTLICRESTAALFNESGSVVRMPIKGSDELLEIRSKDLRAAGGHGTLTACTPESLVESSSSSSKLGDTYDLAVLAMQEPQYSGSGVRELISLIAEQRIPTMAITNMPLIPYLKRIPKVSATGGKDDDDEAIRSCFSEPALWDSFEPDLLTQCSPDPQAFRPDADDSPNVLQVRLPTNFKAARFASDGHTEILRRLERDIQAARYLDREIPVKLRVHDSLFVPLAKWAMLLAGNYRCVRPYPADVISIAEAVTSDLEASRAVYDWVVRVCVDLGGDAARDFVPFDKYAAAAKSLRSPSSAARALKSGAVDIERVDKLVLLIASRHGKQLDAVTSTVAAVDEWLARNRKNAAESK